MNAETTFSNLSTSPVATSEGHDHHLRDQLARIPRGHRRIVLGASLTAMLWLTGHFKGSPMVALLGAIALLIRWPAYFWIIIFPENYR